MNWLTIIDELIEENDNVTIGYYAEVKEEIEGIERATAELESLNKAA